MFAHLAMFSLFWVPQKKSVQSRSGRREAAPYFMGPGKAPFGGFAHTGTQGLSSGGLAAALRFCTELLVAIKTTELTHDGHQMRGTIFK